MSTGCRSTLVAFLRVAVQALRDPCWQRAVLPPCQAGLRKVRQGWEPQCWGPSLLRTPSHLSPLDPDTSRNFILTELQRHILPGLWEFSFPSAPFSASPPKDSLSLVTLLLSPPHHPAPYLHPHPHPVSLGFQKHKGRKENLFGWLLLFILQLKSPLRILLCRLRIRNARTQHKLVY